MPKEPLHVIEAGPLRAEVYQSNGRGVSVELMLNPGGYRLSLFPHELDHVDAIVGKLREALKVPLLALAKRGSA